MQRVLMNMNDDVPPSRSARYFIAACPRQHKPFVVLVEAGESLPARECPECGATGEFIPGAYYSAPFLDTVSRVIDAVHAAHLSPRAAEAASEQLDAIVREPTVKQLRAALSGLPGLEPLEMVLPGASEAARQDLRRFVSLLRAVLLVYADHQGRASARDIEPARRGPAETPAADLRVSGADSD